MKQNTPKAFRPHFRPPIDHPQAAEYYAYAEHRLYPLAFWDWLKEQHPDIAMPGKSALGYELQNMIDGPMVSPIRRVAVQRNKFARVVAKPTTLVR